MLECFNKQIGLHIINSFYGQEERLSIFLENCYDQLERFAYAYMYCIVYNLKVSTVLYDKLEWFVYRQKVYIYNLKVSTG